MRHGRIAALTVMCLLLAAAGVVATRAGTHRRASEAAAPSPDVGRLSTPPPTTTAPSPAAEPSRTARSLLPAHVVLLGDSVASGARCRCPGFGAELSRLTHARLSNDAVGGLTSAGLLALLATPDVRRDVGGASVVTITIGANDFNSDDAMDPRCSDLSCYAADRQVMVDNVGRVLAAAHALVPRDSVIVVTGYWNVFVDGRVGSARGSTFRDASDRLTRGVNRDLAEVAAAAGARFVDLYAPFKGDGDRDDTGLLADDGDHPNAAGHHLIALTIAAALGLH